MAGTKLTQLYLIYDERDTDAASPWADYLFEKKFEVIRPVFEGDEAEVREYHEENLRTCDAALILYGTASECWLRRKLRELEKSVGYGRSKPSHVAISLVPPATPEKERFRTHGAMMISQLSGFSPEPLQPFISRSECRMKRGQVNARLETGLTLSLASVPSSPRKTTFSSAEKSRSTSSYGACARAVSCRWSAPREAESRRWSAPD